MTGKHLLIAMAISTVLLINTGAFAGGGMGGEQGHMMGSGRNDMMGSGQGFSSPWTLQPQRSPSYQYEQREREKLREEIRAKRQELSDLYRSEKSNKEMIDQRIAELDELEAALDEKLSDGR